MRHETYVQELHVTEQNIRQARSHIVSERALIQALRKKGRDSQAAERLLHALEFAVDVMEQHRDLIREELVLGRFGPGNGIRH
jgi:exosome complex RNA-binding protein Rrp42 (RNase PH superfamily)